MLLTQVVVVVVYLIPLSAAGILIAAQVVGLCCRYCRFQIILVVVFANYLRCFLSMAIEGVFNKNMINFLNFCIYICLVEKKVVSLHPNSHACTHFVRFV